MAQESLTPSVRLYQKNKWVNKGTSTTWWGLNAFGGSYGMEISFTPTKATTSSFQIIIPSCVTGSAQYVTFQYRVTNSQKNTAPSSVTGNIASGSVRWWQECQTYTENCNITINVNGISANTKYYVYIFANDVNSGSVGFAGNKPDETGTIKCYNNYSTTTYYASLYDLTNSTYLTAETSYTTSSITAPSLTGYKYIGYKRGSSQSNAFNKTSYDSTSDTASLTATNNHCIFYYQEDITYYTITCKDRIYSSSGTLLNTYTQSSKKSYAKGSTAKGSDWGTSSPYTGYYYDGCTQKSSVSANSTVYRDFSPNSYTVKYNLNGASGTAPTSTSRYYNETYKLTSTVPTRSGYAFIGWNTSSSASTGYTHNDTMTASKSTSSITYYAIWKKEFYYRMYDVTNSEYLDTSPSTSTASSITCPSAPTGYTYAGYKYNTSFPNCESQSDYDGTGISCSTYTSYPYILFCYTLTTYTVSYNLNGASGTAPANTTRYYNKTYKLTSTIPERDGFIFKGWNTVSNASTGYTHNDTMPASTSTQTITYYAIWEQIKYYITVKYHMNDGSDNFFATKNYDSTAINVPFNIIEETPTRDKYEFLGWGTYALDTTPDHQPGKKNLTYQGNTSSGNPAICNFYAVWKKKGNVYYCINNKWLLCETYICKNRAWVPCQLSYSPSGTSWKQ